MNEFDAPCLKWLHTKRYLLFVWLSSQLSRYLEIGTNKKK